MATRTFLGVLLSVTSFPFIILSRVCELFDLFCVRGDLTRCLDVVRSGACAYVSDALLDVLILAEDRRNAIHYGVDPIAMARALTHFALYGAVEGASTIEQQFVRVVVGRYERTLSRKLREQMLAVALARRVPKRLVAATYLSIAFFGKDLIGLTGIEAICESHPSNVTYWAAPLAIARLKYPHSFSYAGRRSNRYRARINHLRSMLLEPNTDWAGALVKNRHGQELLADHSQWH